MDQSKYLLSHYVYFLISSLPHTVCPPAKEGKFKSGANMFFCRNHQATIREDTWGHFPASVCLFELRPPNWVFGLHCTRWCSMGGDTFFCAEIIRPSLEKMPEAIFLASKVRHFKLRPPNWVFGLYSTRWCYEALSGIFANGGLMISAKKKLSPPL